MRMEAVGPLVKRLRKERGLTQGQLAAFARVGRSWIAHVESGRIGKPEQELLQALARVLRVPAETLLAAAGYRVAPLPIPEQRDPLAVLAELAAMMRERPILVRESTQAVSAGPGAPTEPELWPYYPRPDERSHRFIAVRVTGDCMVPRILPGHRVIVDLDASPRPGDIVVALHDGESVVKELQRRNDDLWLVALQHQPPIAVTPETRIVGVVKQVSYRP